MFVNEFKFKHGRGEIYMRKILLGVNIDHIATIRQARGTNYPNPVEAAVLAEAAGADGITVHLREDRRHIQDYDIYALQKAIKTRLNLEMAVTDKMIDFALKTKPAHCCFVPEKRAELTTEGGLDVLTNEVKVRLACEKLQNAGMEVSLFIDAHEAQIEAAVRCKAKAIEIHTGQYAEVADPTLQHIELVKIIHAVKFAHDRGLIVNAGHGLHYENVQAIAKISFINELNIGHAIIAKAMMIGMREAVKEMRNLMDAGNDKCQKL